MVYRGPPGMQAGTPMIPVPGGYYPVSQVPRGVPSFTPNPAAISPFSSFPETQYYPQAQQAGLGMVALGGAAIGGISALISGIGGGGPVDILPGWGLGAGGGGNGSYGPWPQSGIGPGGVPISGPGVPEPPRAMVAKQWVTKVYSNTYGTYFVYFFKLLDGRIMSYNAPVKEWKIWRPRKNIVISSDPRMSMVRKLERTYDRIIHRMARKSKHLKLAKAH